MSDYKVEIEGKYDLDEINLQIAGEEAGASKFKSSKVSDNKKANIVTFSKLPAGTIPNPVKLIKQGDPQPPGTQKIWSGAMVVQGTNTAVTAYRTE
jgi:hypothetical protein